MPEAGIFIWDKMWEGVHPVRIVPASGGLVRYSAFKLDGLSWLGSGNIRIAPPILGVWEDDC